MTRTPISSVTGPFVTAACAADIMSTLAENAPTNARPQRRVRLLIFAPCRLMSVPALSSIFRWRRQTSQGAGGRVIDLGRFVAFVLSSIVTGSARNSAERSARNEASGRLDRGGFRHARGRFVSAIRDRGRSGGGPRLRSGRGGARLSPHHRFRPGDRS